MPEERAIDLYKNIDEIARQLNQIMPSPSYNQILQDVEIIKPIFELIRYLPEYIMNAVLDELRAIISENHLELPSSSLAFDYAFHIDPAYQPSENQVGIVKLVKFYIRPVTYVEALPLRSWERRLLREGEYKKIRPDLRDIDPILLSPKFAEQIKTGEDLEKIYRQLSEEYIEDVEVNAEFTLDDALDYTSVKNSWIVKRIVSRVLNILISDKLKDNQVVEVFLSFAIGKGLFEKLLRILEKQIERAERNNNDKLAARLSFRKISVEEILRIWKEKPEELIEVPLYIPTRNFPEAEKIRFYDFVKNTQEANEFAENIFNFIIGEKALSPRMRRGQILADIIKTEIHSPIDIAFDLTALKDVIAQLYDLGLIDKSTILSDMKERGLKFKNEQFVEQLLKVYFKDYIDEDIPASYWFPSIRDLYTRIRKDIEDKLIKVLEELDDPELVEQYKKMLKRHKKEIASILKYTKDQTIEDFIDRYIQFLFTPMGWIYLRQKGLDPYVVNDALEYNEYFKHMLRTLEGEYLNAYQDGQRIAQAFARSLPKELRKDLRTILGLGLIGYDSLATMAIYGDVKHEKQILFGLIDNILDMYDDLRFTKENLENFEEGLVSAMKILAAIKDVDTMDIIQGLRKIYDNLTRIKDDASFAKAIRQEYQLLLEAINRLKQTGKYNEQISELSALANGAIFYAQMIELHDMFKELKDLKEEYNSLREQSNDFYNVHRGYERIMSKVRNQVTGIKHIDVSILHYSPTKLVQEAGTYEKAAQMLKEQWSKIKEALAEYYTRTEKDKRKLQQLDESIEVAVEILASMGDAKYTDYATIEQKINRILELMRTTFQRIVKRTNTSTLIKLIAKAATALGEYHLKKLPEVIQQIRERMEDALEKMPEDFSKLHDQVISMLDQLNVENFEEFIQKLKNINSDLNEKAISYVFKILPDELKHALAGVIYSLRGAVVPYKVNIPMELYTPEELSEIEELTQKLDELRREFISHPEEPEIKREYEANRLKLRSLLYRYFYLFADAGTILAPILLEADESTFMKIAHAAGLDTESILAEFRRNKEKAIKELYSALINIPFIELLNKKDPEDKEGRTLFETTFEGMKIPLIGELRKAKPSRAKKLTSSLWKAYLSHIFDEKLLTPQASTYAVEMYQIEDLFYPQQHIVRRQRSRLGLLGTRFGTRTEGFTLGIDAEGKQVIVNPTFIDLSGMAKYVSEETAANSLPFMVGAFMEKGRVTPVYSFRGEKTFDLVKYSSFASAVTFVSRKLNEEDVGSRRLQHMLAKFGHKLFRYNIDVICAELEKYKDTPYYEPLKRLCDAYQETTKRKLDPEMIKILNEIMPQLKRAR